MASRRQFLIAGAAAGGVALVAGSAVFVVEDHYENWILKVLHRWLPGYRLEPNGLARFVDDYFAKQGHSTKLRLFGAAEGLVDAKAVLLGGMETKIEDEERRMLSAFLVGSDFFENYPDGPKTISYRGAPVACGSIFATF